MDGSLTISDLENFLSKRALRLLGMYLSTQGRALLDKKETLTIRCFQGIFWKALRPIFNQINIYSASKGERLHKMFRGFLLLSTLGLNNFALIWGPRVRGSGPRCAFPIKSAKRPQTNSENVLCVARKSPAFPLINRNGRLSTCKPLDSLTRPARVFSELLSRAGKLNTLRILLSEYEKKIPINSTNGYNQQRVNSSNVRRLFWRQSKRAIDRLSKDLQKNTAFGAKGNFLMKSEACAVCSLDECLEDEDLFVYCDRCSIMVHRLCLHLDSENLKQRVWFCPDCERKNIREQALESMLRIVEAKPSLNIQCGRKNKSKIRKNVSMVLKEIFEISEGPCLLCGKEGSVTLPVQGVPDHYAHISCAKWVQGVSLSPDFRSIYFEDPDLLSEKLNPFNEHIELWSSQAQFFSSTLYPVDQQLKRLFTSDNFKKDLLALKDSLKICYKSSAPALIKEAKYKLSSRLKKNMDLMLKKNKFCKCLYHSLISKNFLFILRRYLCYSVSLFKDEQMMARVAGTISELYPFIKGNYHRPRSPKASCSDCHLPQDKKCKICMSSQGLFVKCSEEKCARIFHVECARRVMCELIPLGLLSNSFLIFCPEHSKGPVFRRVDNFRKRMTHKSLEVCNQLLLHHDRVMLAKNQLYREGNFKYFEKLVHKEFEREKELKNKPKEEIQINGLKLESTETNGANGKTRRIKKNKFLKLLQSKESIMKERIKRSVLNCDSYWFLQFKKARVAKHKISWNLKKLKNDQFSLKNISLFN